MAYSHIRDDMGNGLRCGKPKQDVKGGTDLDDFDFDEYDEDEPEADDLTADEAEDEEV